MRLQTLIEEFYHAYVELQCRTTRHYTHFQVGTQQKEGKEWAVMKLTWETENTPGIVAIATRSYSIPIERLAHWIQKKEQKTLYYQIFDAFEQDEE
jgi:hypothetical protein